MATFDPRNGTADAPVVIRYVPGTPVPMMRDAALNPPVLKFPDYYVFDELVEEGVGTQDTLTTMAMLGIEIVEGTEFGDVALAGSSTSLMIVDDLMLGDGSSGTMGISETIVELLVFEDEIVGSLPSKVTEAQILDRVNVLDPTILDWRRGGKAIAGIGLADAAQPAWGKAIRENLRLQSLFVGNFHVTLQVTDGLRFRDRVRIGLPVTALEGVGIADLLAAVRAVKIIDRLGLTDAMTLAARTNVSVVDRIRFRDALRNFFGADVVEELGMADAVTGKARALTVLLDQLGFAEASTPMVSFRAVVQDGIELSDEQLLQMIWTGTLIDEVQFDIGHLGVNGEFTAWTMNTRTNAVTEYQNYEFNSFARTGFKYLGASSTGLYELIGDTDDGEDIVATLRGGYLQFGGTRLSRLKEAYVSVRAPNAKVYLKIIAGDGPEYLYEVDTRSMRNTKVHMGKGMRARYFAYELSTEGQDFDLSSIEFVPLVVQRRV